MKYEKMLRYGEMSVKFESLTIDIDEEGKDYFFHMNGCTSPIYIRTKDTFRFKSVLENSTGKTIFFEFYKSDEQKIYEVVDKNVTCKTCAFNNVCEVLVDNYKLSICNLLEKKLDLPESF